MIELPAAGHRCGGCGSPEIDDDWIILDVECTPGPRERRHALTSTLTRNFLVCPACFMSPAAGILRNAVSDAYARPAPTDYPCVTLCVKPRMHRVYRKAVRRRKVRCPGCYGVSRVYWINHELTPRLLGRLSRVFG